MKKLAFLIIVALGFLNLVTAIGIQGEQGAYALMSGFLVLMVGAMTWPFVEREFE